MGISWGLRVLGIAIGGRRNKRPLSFAILLTSLRHVNRPEAGFTPQRIQNSVLGSFASSKYAPQLTVPHKTVA
jgi:hypothetical protein